MGSLMVNIDHVATLREARGINYPEPVYAAGIAEMAGASGIIVHLREDRRHIKDRDVRLLREVVRTKLNLEMAATPEMVQIATNIKPDMVTLVPEKRQELTTEGGLDVVGQSGKLRKTVESLRSAGIFVSLFIDPSEEQLVASQKIHADMIEIHTGTYSDAVNEKIKEEELKKIARSAMRAKELGLGVNAGHGLHYHNVKEVAAIREIDELSIGHSIIARAVFVGLDMAVRSMIELINQ
ncbi:MAG TPA: pyridoxine 5'-phosphate synthase [Syntrophorhabdus sp.]|nr:pyridoxine 5'-phosphate synthase [Syntrophorhabdus sp.]MDI9557900.1 pyridoxine 5'-phosphate synthase [Pseudomonadota bacterium]OPX95397.1 MAG: Pyridoxine 5'-phosphate synthase [Syntrophorhabdus sp. PtaB.Bin027]OQB75525.1 MAG: Pyridoxine 5'-phosphate synthase [Deltaproteobacteria bacterium ADurb.Bin135]HNQ47289.1 pyridoxine 5'-phosphate synthase [Syntrophorhabdus sp.]